MEGGTPNWLLEWAKAIGPPLALVLTAGWIGTLIQSLRDHRKNKAIADKREKEADAVDIANETNRLQKYINAKDTMAQLLKSNQGLVEQVGVLQTSVQDARRDLGQARSDIEARNAVIKHQQEENRWLIDREKRFYETISKCEASEKQCRIELAEQNKRLNDQSVRITELEKMMEQKTEASLRVPVYEEDSSSR